jgi:hypothetical protein
VEKAMSDDFGLLNLVVSPFLERIGREERLGDQLRKPKNLKSKPDQNKQDNAPPEGDQNDDDSMSSQHIDLRI